MANTFAMMVIMIGLSLFGRPELAADFGIVHGATVALFYSCSGNARSIILSRSKVVDTAYILRVRCYLLIPLSALAFVLSIGLVSSGWLFALVLILRRASEWLAEVFLSEQEFDRHFQGALRSFLTQGIASFFVLVALCLDTAIGFWVLVVWSLTPLCWCVRRSMFVSALRRDFGGFKYLQLLLPHFGSTAVIGVSVFVFRLFIILLVGSEVAGDLFSAFALGGILGALFSQALGPTLVHNEFEVQSSGKVLRYLNLLVWGSLGLGILLVGLALLRPELFHWTGKHDLFWLAVGYSLMGGAVMVKAQRMRLRLIQSDEAQDALGSDILANILLIGCIPFLYHALGTSSLTALYLLSSTLSLVFYASEKNGLLSSGLLKGSTRWVLPSLAFLLFIPLFFQLSGGWYHGQHPYFSSEGKLAQLPIPVSVLACYVGIAIYGRYTTARLSLIFVFFLFMGMLLTSLLLAGDAGIQGQSKLILIVQYILPVFALVLGQQCGKNLSAISIIAKVWLVMLLLIVPVEVYSTISKGPGTLSPSVYLFSIYQHMQYVPVIFSSGFIIALFSLFHVPWYRKLLFLFAPIMGIYLALSFSMLAYLLVGSGVLVFLVRNILSKNGIKQTIVLMLLGGLGVALSLFFLASGAFMQAKFGVNLHIDHLTSHVAEVSAQLETQPLSNRQERLAYWNYYLIEVFDNFRSFWLGHEQAPDRSKIPSAHNYYLDFIYNFGFLAVLPILGLISFTIYSVIRNASRIWASSEVLGATGVVVFLLLADNMLKVGMRQPYPGILTFFLWGVVIAILVEMKRGKGAPQQAGPGSNSTIV
ncbi:hypothetical protein [Pseudomonas sp. S2_E01]